MPDVIKPGPPGDGGEDEHEDNGDVTMDLMGSRRDFPLQVSVQGRSGIDRLSLLLCLSPRR